MRNINWTAKSLRAFKKLIRKNPQLRPQIEQTLRQLAEDPFHPSLRAKYEAILAKAPDVESEAYDKISAI